MESIYLLHRIEMWLIHFTRQREKFFVNKDFEPKKINLNTISQETFRHPYVKWKESQAILAYRLQHGSFQSLDQLQDIAALPPGWLEKLKPYLSLE